MEELIKQIEANFKAFKISQEQAGIAVKALLDEHVSGTKESVKAATERAEKLAIQVTAFADKLVELEQKLVKNVVNEKIAPKSLGVLVATSEEFKAFASGKSERVRMETKFSFNASTTTGQTASPSTNSDILVPVDRLPGIIPGAFRMLRIRDVIPSSPTGSNMIEFTRELLFTNNAAETKEGGSKPESDITFELGQAPVVTIAHWLKLTKQVLADSPQLAAYIDNRLRYGVELRVDNQLIGGNGTGQNLSGMTKSGNYTAFTPVTGDSALDSINRAKYQLLAADYAASAVLLNPVDWGKIERSKADDSGIYLIGDPRSSMGPFLWGMPVVVSNAVTAGKLVIAAFNVAYGLFQREGVAVEMTNSNDTDFIKNLITVRAEERLALATFRPASALYGSLVLGA